MSQFERKSTYQTSKLSKMIQVSQIFDSALKSKLMGWIALDLKARLQGAKVDGFEGAKRIELKINRKLKAKGMSPIRL